MSYYYIPVVVRGATFTQYIAAASAVKKEYSITSIID